MTRHDPYQRHARRARRAWRNRDNAYPVFVVGPDEPILLTAIAALTRWVWRHRSALGPFTITVAAFVFAAITHTNHAGWWVPITAITTVTTVTLGIPHERLRRYPAGRTVADILARLWRACGLDRAVERGYAATVTAVAGGWLAVAVTIGPTTRPLPTIALLATLILGIPWWIHRRRRARVRVERTIDAWPSIADNIGLPGSRIASVLVDTWGWTARVVLRKGMTAGQATEKISAIESGLGVRAGSVRVLPDAHRADRFVMRVIETDPHAQPIPWPGPSTNSITKPIDIGLFEDGRPVRAMFLRRNVLIGGMVGSGKSGVLNVILGNLTACRDVVIWGVDLKGGMELQPWLPCLDRLATTPEQAAELFTDAIRELNRRTEEQAAHGSRVWEPSPENPALVIVVDEYAEMPEEARDYADSIARRGRAVAVNLWAATQRPTQEAMGHGAVRSQMDIRICLRVRERRDVDLILGQGSFASGWHAHTITQPGVFLISAPEHTTPERARAYLLDDQRVTRHVAQYTHGRPVPGTPGRPDRPAEAPQRPQTSEPTTAGTGQPTKPDAALWRALSEAPPEGMPISDLMAASGMGRSWVYYRIQEHVDAGRAVQTSRGSWRATTPSDNPPGGIPRPRRPRGPELPGHARGTPRHRRARRPGRDET